MTPLISRPESKTDCSIRRLITVGSWTNRRPGVVLAEFFMPRYEFIGNPQIIISSRIPDTLRVSHGSKVRRSDFLPSPRFVLSVFRSVPTGPSAFQRSTSSTGACPAIDFQSGATLFIRGVPLLSSFISSSSSSSSPNSTVFPFKASIAFPN